ncbi:exosortase [Steroidobacter sp. S1-65]|uniref:Exosortase n=1 Tax=Steroidobacter gossypii TaxID=2805490 RepID=A0ABS1WYY3_9GAMM|nr:exosortase A [Steroidobacter gossypii]MBM0106193.1 exosortase [Steroidobacter gossypii]
MSSPRLPSAPLADIASNPTASSRALNLRAAGSIAIVVLGLLLFWPTTASLIEHWEDTVRRTYTHGYLLVGIVLWLLWRNRVLWADVPVRPSLLAFLGVLGAGVVWLIALRAALQIVHQVLLPLILFGAFVSCYGWQAGRRLSLTFALLYFAVPVWDVFTPLLQTASVVAVQFLLRVVSIPAFVSGNIFTLPAGSLEVADGCAGLHFFVVGLTIAALYGEINHDSLWTRIKLMAFAMVLAMLTNWVRIFIIAIAAQATDMQHYLVREEHYSFGWALFAVTLVAFFLVVRRWPAAPEPQATAAVGAPISWLGAALAGAGLLFAPVWQHIDDNVVADHAPAQALPNAMTGWSVARDTHSDWLPVFNGADVTERATFTRAGASVEAFAATYKNQHQGKELMGFGNSLEGESLHVSRRGGAEHPWLETEATDSLGERWLLWHSYRLDERWFDRPLALQIQYGIGALMGAPAASILAFRTPCKGVDCTDARATLQHFAATVRSSDKQ